jgi:ssRNA-specific RNase YbeY (16S rRNA maturation enzyme)
MIDFNYENEYNLQTMEASFLQIHFKVQRGEKKEGEITLIFVTTYLHKINLEYLNHDTLTDVISLITLPGNEISGDYFFSVGVFRITL